MQDEAVVPKEKLRTQDEAAASVGGRRFLAELSAKRCEDAEMKSHVSSYRVAGHKKKEKRKRG